MAEEVEDWVAHARASELFRLVEALRGEEAEDWLAAAVPRLPETVRVNPLREDVGWTIAQLEEMGAEPIDWYTGAGGAFTLPWLKNRCPDPDLRSRIQTLHATGRITQQEAASMLPVQALGVKPGHAVLDLCAAPGSKTTQIAEALAGEGFVMANEVNPGRANHLVSNVHRTGFLNVAICQQDGRHFPRVAAPGFDRVITDVPCTGTGTTRKNTDVWEKWTPHGGRHMHKLQRDIAMRGAMLLRGGGRMIYSTCSVDPLENEAVVAALLRRCDWLELVPIDVEATFPGLTARPGLATWPILDADADPRGLTEDHLPPEEPEIQAALAHCVRVWNDESGGGGFFLAALRQTEADADARSTRMHPAEVDREQKTRDVPRPGKDALKTPEPDLIEPLLADWGLEEMPYDTWSRGHHVHISAPIIRERLFAPQRIATRGWIWPGGHWHPHKVLQVGQPAWKLRKGRNRLLSRGLHGLAPLVKVHRHRIHADLLRHLLKGEEPGRSTVEEMQAKGWFDAEVCASLASERDGGVLLEVEHAGEILLVPAWLAGKLSLMLPPAEADVLRAKLE